MSRLQRLRQNLAQQELDVLLVSQPENRRYLSGFTGSAGWLLISASDAFLAVDFRYVEQAKKEAPDFDVVHVKGDLANWLPKLTSDSGFKKVGFEADQVPFAIYQQLCKTAGDGGCQIQLIPTSGLVESVRAVKEPEEIEFIAEAVKLADDAFEHAKSVIRPSVSEKEIAWELERFLRESGSEPMPFDIIVASGSNAALPHAKPSEKVILENEPVVIDLGARVNGYCSDLSRTFFLGDADKTFSKIYDIVLGAQLTALAAITSGISGDQADRLARTVVEQAGYGDAFGHGLGHGVGLGAHESPRLGPNSSDLLIDGMVFTVEPGIYIAGWGGVRIEDTVAMENGKIKALTRADKIANIC
ncbi:MAG: aminopeptidase P family protein [Chloroflexi bacterium]|nr:aminopeptidase P family protein [Chloroflexota bacterium]MBL7062175.1 aminopeptidase P family protein [Dehalococcoidia bacterium]